MFKNLEQVESITKSEFNQEIEKRLENPDNLIFDRIKAILKNIDDDQNELSNKIKDIYSSMEEDDKREGGKVFIEFIKFIYTEVAKYKNDNIKETLLDFFGFISDMDTFKNEYMKKLMDIKREYIDSSSEKDFILLLKKKIAEEYLKTELDFSKTKASEMIMVLLEYNYNLNQLYKFFSLFKNYVKEDEIFKSLISTLVSYPNVKIDSTEFEELITQYKEKDSKGTEILNPKIALTFYLNISGKDINNNEETEKEELLHELKKLNPNISDGDISRINTRIENIEKFIKENSPNFISEENFLSWSKKAKKMKFNTKQKFDKNTEEFLGVISIAVKKENDYYLRKTQLLSLLLFIYKETNKGLIEEIATGEGKSIIIASLSIYYALRNKYVDVITSGYTLAQRDSKKFTKLFSLFNLTTSYPRNFESEPYKANILYGTFLEFEGDILRELTSEHKIRHPRNYEVLIVDEVDNLFIDNILGSTRLTNSSRGFKFLGPHYFTTYFSVLLCDFCFKIFLKIKLKQIKDENEKRKFEAKINDPKERLEEIKNIIQNLFNEIKSGNQIKTDENNETVNYKEEDGQKVQKNFNEFLNQIVKYLEYPSFLKDFLQVEENYWLNSAWEAENEMKKDTQYVIAFDREGNKDIAPVDRKNTGEIELSTVYDEGLHQMLEIKHRLRIREETVVHTFLSHITYFNNYYEENKEFLFFGLSGTVGKEETKEIYKNQYKSNILFIPPYKKKRFVELPPILCKKDEHYKIICEDILSNFDKERKVLVICDSIDEANQIKEYLCNPNDHDINIINNEGNIYNIHNIESNIVLYTRSDLVREDFLEKNSDKKIFLSTNLGGRGTDLKTSPEEESKGGLHVILTSMPKNYRVLKQAFGRTSREGKKGTGQLILYDEQFDSYEEIKKYVNKKEEERIQFIQKKLKILLFKDDLFKRFIELLKEKKINTKELIFDEIKYRWANFLKLKVTSKGKDLNEKEAELEFGKFKKDIENILNENNIDDKFENKFYQMEEGIRKYSKFSKELMNYFVFTVDETNKKFYFAQSYIKAIIRIVNGKTSKSYDEVFYSDVIRNLKETQKRINSLIEDNINPILDSFNEWEGYTHELLKYGEFEKYLENNPFENQKFEKTELFEQYSNIKTICEKIHKKIDENIFFINNYKKIYNDNPNYSIFVKRETLEQGLSLEENEIKEIQFFEDSTLSGVYTLSLKFKEPSKDDYSILDLFKKFLKYIGNKIKRFVAPIIYKLFSYHITLEEENFEFSNNSIIGSLFQAFVRKIGFGGNEGNNRDDNVQTFEDASLSGGEIKELLFKDIKASIDKKFNEKINEIENIKFLLFIDKYFQENIWKEKITKICEDNFTNVYKKQFEEKNNIFNKQITNETYEEHKNNYNEIFNSYLKQCIKEIKELLYKKDYNETTGLNSLEHLIKNLNPEAITEEVANKTVQKIMEYGLITKERFINIKYFKDCLEQKDEKTKSKESERNIMKKPNIKININININNDSMNSIMITNLNDFEVNNLEDKEIPKVNASFFDISRVYQKGNYNNLLKDYSFFIINNLKIIFTELLLFKNEEYNNFKEFILNLMKKQIEKLLLKNNFNKYKKKKMDKIIVEEFNPEEKIRYSTFLKDTGKELVSFLHKNNKIVNHN